MEADLKVGCSRTVLDYDLQIGVWDVLGVWFGGGRRLRYSSISLTSQWWDRHLTHKYH